MFTNHGVPNQNEIDSLASQTDGMISNYRNALSIRPREDPYSQEQLRCQTESLYRQLSSHLDRLRSVLQTIEDKILSIEHDYETVCSDMTLLNSDSARSKYDRSVMQLEDMHRKHISIQQLLQSSIGKVQSTISGGGSTYATGSSQPALLRQPQPKDMAPDSLDHLYDIDAACSREDSAYYEPQCWQAESVTLVAQQGDPIDNSVREQPVSENAVFVELNTSDMSSGNDIEDLNKSQRSDPEEVINQHQDFIQAAERMEEIILNQTFQCQDYHLSAVDSLIDDTRALLTELADYCKELPPITSENWTNSMIEHWYAVKEDYQGRMHCCLGGLYEYLAAAESEVRWVDYNMSLDYEISPFDSNERDTESPDSNLEQLRNEHLGAITKIKAEIDSLESLLVSLDKKSWPYRQPKKDYSLDKLEQDPNESSAPDPKHPSTDQVSVAANSPAAMVKSDDSKEDGPAEQPTDSPYYRPCSGHTEGSALFFYNYKTGREGGTKDLLDVTDQAITTLLKSNDVLPTIDSSEYYYAENVYARKEKYKLDVLQTLRYLNIHLCEVTSEMNKLQFWLENPIKDDDPRYNVQTKQQELRDRLAVKLRCRDGIMAMIAKAQKAIVLADEKLWLGKKPLEQFDVPKGPSLSPPKIDPREQCDMPKGLSSASNEVGSLAKDKYS